MCATVPVTFLSLCNTNNVLNTSLVRNISNIQLTLSVDSVNRSDDRY